MRSGSLKGRRGRLPSKPKTSQESRGPNSSSSSSSNNNISDNNVTHRQPITIQQQQQRQHAMGPALGSLNAGGQSNSKLSALARSQIESSPDPNNLDYSQVIIFTVWN